MGFWGVGPKAEPNWADLASCENLSNLNDEVKQVYPQGLDFLFILATRHGEHNGFSPESSKSYAKKMESVFKKRGFRLTYSDPLWEKYGISFEKIDYVWSKKARGWWSKIPGFEDIESKAAKRNTRLPAQVAAQKYYVMRDLEKGMLEKEFSQHIFHAFADPELRCVLPNLPTLYFYGIKRGRSDPPWFVTAPEQEDNQE